MVAIVGPRPHSGELSGIERCMRNGKIYRVAAAFFFTATCVSAVGLLCSPLIGVTAVIVSASALIISLIACMVFDYLRIHAKSPDRYIQDEIEKAKNLVYGLYVDHTRRVPEASPQLEAFFVDCVKYVYYDTKYLLEQLSQVKTLKERDSVLLLIGNPTEYIASFLSFLDRIKSDNSQNAPAGNLLQSIQKKFESVPSSCSSSTTPNELSDLCKTLETLNPEDPKLDPQPAIGHIRDLESGKW